MPIKEPESDLHFRVRIKKEYREAVEMLHGVHLMSWGQLYAQNPKALPNLSLFIDYPAVKDILYTSSTRGEIWLYSQPELQTPHISRFGRTSGWWSAAINGPSTTLDFLVQRVLLEASDAWSLCDMFGDVDGKWRHHYVKRNDLQVHLPFVAPVIFKNGVPPPEGPHPFQSTVGEFVCGERQQLSQAQQAASNWTRKYQWFCQRTKEHKKPHFPKFPSAYDSKRYKRNTAIAWSAE